jgi:hypothetical protein
VKKICLLAILAITSVTAAGCLSRGEPVAASASYAEAAINLRRPNPDRTRVYVVLGFVSQGVGPFARTSQVGISGDIYFNTVNIGTVNPGEVMVFDVRPDTYTTWWQYHGSKATLTGNWKHSERALNGGQVLFLSADAVDRIELTAIAVTGFVDKGQLKPEWKITRPANCPPTICVPE